MSDVKKTTAEEEEDDDDEGDGGEGEKEEEEEEEAEEKDLSPSLSSENELFDSFPSLALRIDSKASG